MMRHSIGLVVAGALLFTFSAQAFAQRTVVGGKPRVTISPAPWIPTPSPVQSIFPTTKSHALFSSGDFFPAAPTVLLDNTNLLPRYFPEPNIVLDDANIPDTRDTDSDDIYYLTSIDYAFYVPAALAVSGEVYIAGVDSLSGGPDPSDLSAPIATFSGTLSTGTYILTVTFDRCDPFEQPTLSYTIPSGDTYDYFWTGIKFVGCPSGTGTFPGMRLASGPDFEDDVFWWEGNQSCGGSNGTGFYWFGGTPRASFYLKVMGAADRDDAIVASPDIDGNGCVDDADLLEVLFNFGGTGGAADVNCDGVVDDADLLEVLFNFGSGC